MCTFIFFIFTLLFIKIKFVLSESKHNINSRSKSSVVEDLNDQRHFIRKNELSSRMYDETDRSFTAKDKFKSRKHDNDEDDDSESVNDEPDEILSRKKPSTKGGKVLQKAGVNFVSKLSSGLVKLSRKSIKYSFDLLAGKHATLDQIVGKWKLTQDVEIKPGIIYSCPATFKLLLNGTIITSCNGKVYHTKYTFKERKWPQTCTIKFDAFAFQPPGEAEPINLLYSGFFKRSILNKKVLLMRGKVYQMAGKLWKSKKRCGKFKASQRRY